MPKDEIVDAEPIETAGTEIARVMKDGDPSQMLATLEKKAELAPRMNKAINTILVTQTYPEDWNVQGGKMCLSSAGAERVARLFSIRFFNNKSIREDFADSIGSGYRYVFECQAELGDRQVFAQGAYSTRDKFLGFVSGRGEDGEYRAVEEINENNIRNAAYHICIGNAIKALLGLRGIPEERFKEIMGNAGEDSSKAKVIPHGVGKQGGTAKAKASANLIEHVKQCLRALRPGDPQKQADLYHELADFDGNKGRVVAKAPEFLSEKWLGGIAGKLDVLCDEAHIDPKAIDESEPGPHE
jgi:hypothetical protein